jgi:hypothetical protein
MNVNLLHSKHRRVSATFQGCQNKNTVKIVIYWHQSTVKNHRILVKFTVKRVSLS